jgi:hypothetical protein
LVRWRALPFAARHAANESIFFDGFSRLDSAVPEGRAAYLVVTQAEPIIVRLA